MVGRNEHERRIREAIAFLNEEQQARFQEVPEKARIGELRNLDVVRLVSYGRSPAEFLAKNPPIFELPNRMRRAYEEYEDRSWEDVQDDADSFEQRVFHALESELDFSDPSLDEDGPYSEYPAFQHQDHLHEAALEEVSSRQSQRESLPVKFMNAQGLMIDSTLEEVEQIEGMEAYGWYNPKGNDNERDWGIYIRTSAPEEIANRFFSHLTDRYEAWELAFELILYHEYFHFLSQYHCDRLSTSQPHDEKYWNYIRAWMADLPNAIEEAVANAFAFRKLRSSMDEETQRNVSIWYANQPTPYDEYHNFLSGPDFKFGQTFVASQHAEFEVPPDAELNVMLSTMFRPKPRFPVRLFMVNDIKPEHNVPKLVSFSKVSFHKSVEKKIRKRGIRPNVLKALEEFLSDIRGREFDRLHQRGFVRCSDKIHWRFELPGYHRALMTQIQGMSGWCVVFVGNHREYDAYCKAHGVRIK